MRPPAPAHPYASHTRPPGGGAGPPRRAAARTGCSWRGRATGGPSGGPAPPTPRTRAARAPRGTCSRQTASRDGSGQRERGVCEAGEPGGNRARQRRRCPALPQPCAAAQGRQRTDRMRREVSSESSDGKPPWISHLSSASEERRVRRASADARWPRSNSDSGGRRGGGPGQEAGVSGPSDTCPHLNARRAHGHASPRSVAAPATTHHPPP